jgi:hypothetical protein
LNSGQQISEPNPGEALTVFGSSTSNEPELSTQLIEFCLFIIQLFLDSKLLWKK